MACSHESAVSSGCALTCLTGLIPRLILSPKACPESSLVSEAYATITALIDGEAERDRLALQQNQQLSAEAAEMAGMAAPTPSTALQVTVNFQLTRLKMPINSFKASDVL